MSFACDPGVVTAAYVAEKMGLSFQCSYEAACVFQDKSRFRHFLANNGFNTPKAKDYNDVETALKEADSFSWPIIVKPVDSAGSKGVTKVNILSDLEKAIQWLEKAIKDAKETNGILIDKQSAINLLSVLKELR